MSTTTGITESQADARAGIGQFGTANYETSLEMLQAMGLCGKPIGEAPDEYIKFAREEGLRPCMECLVVPFIETNRGYNCDKCNKTLHSFCGTGTKPMRCADCCLLHGIIEGSPRAEEIKDGTHPGIGVLDRLQREGVINKAAEPVTAAAAPAVPGPNQVGADPGNGGGSGKKKRYRKPTKKDAPPNVGVIEVEDVEIEVVQNVDVVVQPKKQYHAIFIEFMEYTTGKVYAKDQTFHPSVLRKLKPIHITKWMHYKAYHLEKVNYQNTVDRPIYARSNALWKYKSSISYYMPDSSTPWNDRSQSGNPTKSGAVNKLIKRVRDMEGKGLGAEAQGVRDMSEGEFRLMKKLFKTTQKCTYQAFLYECYAVLAYNLIFRSDDTSHLEYKDVKPHDQFDFALKMKVKWGKNVKDPRACPPQIILGCMIPQFCALLHLAVFMEESLQRGHGAAGFEKAFLFSDCQEKNEAGEPLGPSRINGKFQQACTKIFKKSTEFEEFAKKLGGKLGSHSIRKFAATWAKRLGKQASDVEFRGRWKGEESKNRVVNGSYINPEQPFIDADVAAALCHNQPCSYRVHKDASGVTPDWLRKHVVPFMDDFYDGTGDMNNPGLTLAYPLLWAAMSDEMDGYMFQEQRLKIREEYGRINTLPTGVNPVVRVHLSVRRYKDQLVIDERSPEVVSTPAVTPERAGTVDTSAGVTPSPGYATASTPVRHGTIGMLEFQQLFDLTHSNHQKVTSMITENWRSMETMHSNLRVDLMRELGFVQNHMTRNYAQPPNSATVGQRRGALARQGIGERNNGRGRVEQFRLETPAVDKRPARLELNPRNLGSLWLEYQHGIGGTLPARLWKKEHTSHRTNGNWATMYCKRKPIYLLLERTINIKKKLDSEAFRLIEEHFPGIPLSSLGGAIRQREFDGTMHHSLADKDHPLALQPPRKKARRNK